LSRISDDTKNMGSNESIGWLQTTGMVPQDHFLQDGKSRTTQKWRQSEREVKISFVIIEFKSQDASISTHAKTTSSAIDRHTGNEKFRTETVNIAKIKIIDQQKTEEYILSNTMKYNRQSPDFSAFL